jgi:hypothetical protein
MNSRFIIICSILAKHPAQVRLSKYDHVVETGATELAGSRKIAVLKFIVFAFQPRRLLSVIA